MLPNLSIWTPQSTRQVALTPARHDTCTAATQRTCSWTGKAVSSEYPVQLQAVVPLQINAAWLHASQFGSRSERGPTTSAHVVEATSFEAHKAAIAAGDAATLNRTPTHIDVLHAQIAVHGANQLTLHQHLEHQRLVEKGLVDIISPVQCKGPCPCSLSLSKVSAHQHGADDHRS